MTTSESFSIEEFKDEKQELLNIFEKTLHKKDENIEKLQKEINEWKNVLNIKNEKYNILENENKNMLIKQAEIIKENNDFKLSLNDKNELILKLETEINEWKNMYNIKKEKYNILENKNKNIFIKQAEIIKENNDSKLSINEKNELITKAEKEINELLTLVKSIDENNEKNEKNVNKFNDLKDKFKNINNENIKLKNEINELYEKVNNYPLMNDNLNLKMKKVNKKLNKKINEIKNENTYIKNILKNGINHLILINEKNVELNNEIQNLEIKIQNENKNYNISIDEKNDIINKLEYKLKKYKKYFMIINKNNNNCMIF